MNKAKRLGIWLLGILMVLVCVLPFLILAAVAIIFLGPLSPIFAIIVVGIAVLGGIWHLQRRHQAPGG